MEARRDLFDILMNGLPPVERQHIERAIANATAAKRRQIERASVRESRRIENRRLMRMADPTGAWHGSHERDEYLDD